MGDNPDIKTDLPMAMAMAAFVGISWYIGAEINISLWFLFKRRCGLYFWSCLLVSWGVILQPLFIILADFDVWTDFVGSITMIYLTWFIMVVPQSWVLYSRLYLVVHESNMLKWVLAVLVFDSLVFSVPTIVMGTVSQASNVNPRLFPTYLIWDRLQTTVFFVQETSLSILYIWQTFKFLRDSTLLDNSFYPLSARTADDKKKLLYQLICTNFLIIALDMGLLGIQYADLFYLQGAFKPCVYGIKLKVEFVVLNRLVKSLRRRETSTQKTSRTWGNAGQGLDRAGSEATSRRSRMMDSQARGEDVENQDQVGLENLGGNLKTDHGSRAQESQVSILQAEEPN